MIVLYFRKFKIVNLFTNVKSIIEITTVKYVSFNFLHNDNHTCMNGLNYRNPNVLFHY